MTGTDTLALMAGVVLMAMVGLAVGAVFALFIEEPIFVSIMMAMVIIPTVLTVRGNRKVKAHNQKILKMRTQKTSQKESMSR